LPSARKAPKLGFMQGFAPRVKAVLGPTNTGKTHLAMERMLAHASGIIGFPLRLLARENYDRMVARKGARYVGLITGEEKIIPPDARWFACTVEAMPLDRHVEFVGVDEIQLCADPDRGHIFTDRLLRARGMVETMFMGAGTVQADPPAAAQRRRRLLSGRGLCDRRDDPQAKGRLCGGDGAPLPPHAQRPGGAVSGEGGRLPGGDGCHRHGP
jgi:hypothetical protein